MKIGQRNLDLLTLEATLHLADLDGRERQIRDNTTSVSARTYQLAVDVVASTLKIVDVATKQPAVDLDDAEQFLDQAQQVTRQVQGSLEPESWQCEQDSAEPLAFPQSSRATDLAATEDLQR